MCLVYGVGVIVGVGVTSSEGAKGVDEGDTVSSAAGVIPRTSARSDLNNASKSQ